MHTSSNRSRFSSSLPDCSASSVARSLPLGSTGFRGRAHFSPSCWNRSGRIQRRLKTTDLANNQFRGWSSVRSPWHISDQTSRPMTFLRVASLISLAPVVGIVPHCNPVMSHLQEWHLPILFGVFPVPCVWLLRYPHPHFQRVRSLYFFPPPSRNSDRAILSYFVRAPRVRWGFHASFISRYSFCSGILFFHSLCVIYCMMARLYYT